MGRVSRLIQQAREVLQIEAQGVLDLIERVGPEFEQAVEMIIKSKGRVIFTGIGKSGIVGRKIMATLNSTGTHSLFLHPVEAVHGDLPRPLGLVMGSEGEGLHRLVREKCDFLFQISGQSDRKIIDSLNVSVACGILLQQLNTLGG